MAQSKKEAALALLFSQKGVKIEDVKFFIGGASSASEEAVWGELHSAFVQEKEGKARVTTSFHDPAEIKSGREFLLSL